MNKIRLTEIKLEDSGLLFQWINNENLVNLNDNFSYTHEINHLNWVKKVIGEKNSSIFGIRLKNRLIGTCKLYNINNINRSAELQIRIGDTACHGKGFGFDAVNELLRYGFKNMNLRRVYLSVFDDNIRAIRLYEKIGFRREGLLLESEFIEGIYKNLILMALLVTEYE